MSDYNLDRMSPARNLSNKVAKNYVHRLKKLRTSFGKNYVQIVETNVCGYLYIEKLRTSSKNYVHRWKITYIIRKLRTSMMYVVLLCTNSRFRRYGMATLMPTPKPQGVLKATTTVFKA